MGNLLTTVSIRSELRGSVTIPPSKSYTHRAVLISSLAEGVSIIRNPLRSRDTDATVRGCVAFGAVIDDDDEEYNVTGCTPQIPDDVVDVENSGTTLRFLSSALSLAPTGFSVLTGDSSIRRRPMQPLLDALTQLGVFAQSTRGNGCAPVIIGGGGIKGGVARIRGDVSSQFISSLLISAPLAHDDVVILTNDIVSKPYIDATIAVMERFGAKVTKENYSSYTIEAGNTYTPTDFTVPGDFSSASFIAGAVALVGGEVEIYGLVSDLPQGDSAFFSILKSMGVSIVKRQDRYIIQSSGGKLHGGSFDLKDTPDLLPILAVLGLKCDSKIEITGVKHARYKETDRISVLVSELMKVGANVEERQDGIEVKSSQLRRAKLDAHNDHRMFMAFTIVSMLFPGGIPVAGEECLDVSYPAYLEHIKQLGAVIERREK